MSNNSYFKYVIPTQQLAFHSYTLISSKPPNTPRKLPRQDRVKETVEAILTATAHILTETGYDTASTNRITERAGISIGSPYQYFPNKEAIVTALRSRHVDEVSAIIETALPVFPVYRSVKKLDFRFNTSPSALNLAKLDAQRQHRDNAPFAFSMASAKRRALNDH